MVPNPLLPDPEYGTLVREIPAGTTAVLQCSSNDDDHTFMFWQLGQNNIIGPGNDYDHTKYKYEVLSGKLFIKRVTPAETGYYRCISKNLNGEHLNIGAVEMIVKDNRFIQPPDSSSDLETIKIVFIVLSLVILIICAILFYRMKQDDKKRKNRLVMLAEDDDEEGSGDEIYNRTTTVINDAVPGTSKDHITGIDNQGLDTDFNAVFEQISIKAANRNLV